MLEETQELYEFGDFRLDLRERKLTGLDGSIDGSLPDKAFQTLAVLVQNHGRLVAREELFDAVWPDAIVEENNLEKAIHAIRHALGEKPREMKYIETVRKHGYRFVAQVEIVEARANGGDNVPKRSSYRVSDGEAVPSGGPRENSGHKRPLFRNPNFYLLSFAAAVLVFAAFGLYLARSGDGSPLAPERKKTLAVLPLKPIGSDKREELYEVGIADSLITQLDSLEGLVVRPLSATRKYSSLEQDPIAAGREQRVNYVLDSTYQLAEGRIRITARLFNVATGEIVDTYKSERTEESIFLLQDAVASEVAELIAVRFTGPSSTENVLSRSERRGTRNEMAYRLYLQAIYLVEKETVADSKRAIELFDQALSLDQNYARAWVGKALAHCSFAHRRGGSPDADFERAKPAIRKALELDSGLPEIYGVLGIIKTDQDWDFDDGERQFAKAIEIAPDSDMILRWYANRLAALGRYDEAVNRIKTAIDLNPNSLFHQMSFGRILYLARRYDDAVTQLQRVAEMDPSRSSVHDRLWLTFHAKGDHPRAYEHFIKFQQLIGANNELLTRYEEAYAGGGWVAVLSKYSEVQRMDGEAGATDFRKAVVAALLGEREESLRYLTEAVGHRSLEIHAIKSDPGLDSLREDPRFIDLIRKMGI
ncbi:MAG TPA: winged helix-turn-helix domain-containing protein [Pyrinomonadaceae bacterium]|nr:winged helix-turn-helix domain-containing protein [Pyrinomonadaceae bacterium]